MPNRSVVPVLSATEARPEREYDERAEAVRVGQSRARAAGTCIGQHLSLAQVELLKISRSAHRPLMAGGRARKSTRASYTARSGMAPKCSDAAMPPSTAR